MKTTEDQVIEENYGLAMSLASKFYRKTPSFSFEDLLQVSLMSMLKAHRKYNSDRSVFSTFATYCMRNDLIKFVNKNKDLKGLIQKKPEDIQIKEDIDEVLPEGLAIKEQAIFFYKKCNYKDFEIRDILNLEKNEYKQIVKSCYQKISEANG
jgi:RNA polymerase sigma factor (sigma-70 family)